MSPRPLPKRVREAQKSKKHKENKAKLLFFTIFHIKHNGFFTFLCFLHFRTRILTKNATFLAKSGQTATNSNDFGCQGASKHSKNCAFSTFWSENTIKSMVFDVLDPPCCFGPPGAADENIK